jgi:hypothetical protein
MLLFFYYIYWPTLSFVCVDDPFTFVASLFVAFGGVFVLAFGWFFAVGMVVCLLCSLTEQVIPWVWQYPLIVGRYCVVLVVAVLIVAVGSVLFG